MREVGVLEAKTHLSALLDHVEREGEEIVITRHGRAVARLAPPAPKHAPRRLSGPELVARAIALQERISERSPETDTLTWGELKEMAQS